MLSPACGGNSNTVRGAWSRYRPIRFKWVRSARVCVLQLCGGILCKRTRCRACRTRVLLTRCDWPSAPSGSSSSCSSGPFGLAPWARRLKTELCHCQSCVAWVCLPRQPSVAAVRHHRLDVVSSPNVAFLQDLAVLVQLL